MRAIVPAKRPLYGKENVMAKVDPETREPVSDDPNQESGELAGGKLDGDKRMPTTANPTGSSGPTQVGTDHGA